MGKAKISFRTPMFFETPTAECGSLSECGSLRERRSSRGIRNALELLCHIVILEDKNPSVGRPSNTPNTEYTPLFGIYYIRLCW